MFKAKEFKELIGFNHTWLVIVSVLVTGTTFPFIFLGELVNQISHEGAFHAIFGWVYSAIVHYVNLLIFYKFKQMDSRKGKITDIKLFFTRDYPVHMLATVLVTLLMSLGPYSQLGLTCNGLVVVKNIIGTSLLVSVIIGFYETAFYMRALKTSLIEREKLKRENVESQLEILKSQVQPHFLFNSLNTLVSIIPDDPDVAVKYVQNLSKVYRYILEIKDKKLIPVYEEMKCVQAYLFMLETRFGSNLRCKISLENIDENHFIVPLSIQMLVENAVKHNVISAKRPLSIEIISKGEELSVTNNLQLKEQDVISTGTGLQNISSRYLITANKEVKIQEDLESFTVHIPLIEVSAS